MKLSIEKVVYSGAGVAHADTTSGKARIVSVPFTLAGEIVEAEVQGSSAEASLLRVLESSNERVTPDCQHFGACGGCQYQHASYGAQVAIKCGILKETLERAGLHGIPEIEPHTAEPWGYRNRIRLRIASLAGGLRVGYNVRGTGDFLEIDECPIAAPLLWRGAKALRALGGGGSRAYQRLLNELVEVEFFCDAEESSLQVTLFVRRRVVAGFREGCEELKRLLSEVCGVGLVLLHENRGGRRVQRTERLDGWGAPGMTYVVENVGYWVGRGGFFQVNRFLVPTMVDLVTKGRKGLLAWDLYAGVGLFSRVLDFEQVVAVEGGEEASGELVRTMQAIDKKGIMASTEEFLRGAVVQRERPELVVVDPPRAGLGAEVCALLARLWAKELVYVSCDPVTLARDLKMLVNAGYEMVQVHMIDMFPQTFHIETMVVLRR